MSTMTERWLVLCWVLLFLHSGRLQKMEDNFNYTGLTGFPKGFLFSTATASYQVEGAWNESGKGESIWDRRAHTNPPLIANGDTGDVACDSYHKYKEDIENIKYIGFQMYRFSLSWSRLFPTGYTNYTNPDGVRYYNALIDELLNNSIQPMVTLYHWDLPQPLEDIGGWLNPDIAGIFAEYARAVFKLFGNKVKWWVTVNEPKSVTEGYGSPINAPGKNLHGTGEYTSGHNLLRAHGKAYRIYDKEFRKSQKGKVTIVLNGGFNIPKNSSDPTHVEAAERANQFLFGWFGHPVFSEEGDYPRVMREYIDKASQPNASRLPHFTNNEIKEIKGSYDYLGLNHYSTWAAKPGVDTHYPNPSWNRDQNTTLSPIPGAAKSECTWQWVVPDGFRALLNWMKKEFNKPEIFITENGYCGADTIDDQARIDYYSQYLKALLAAINEDGVRVIGYTTWSILDNLEWDDGYTKKFGLIRVDFNNSDRTRTMKRSAKFIKSLIKKNLKASSASIKKTKFVILILISFIVPLL